MDRSNKEKAKVSFTPTFYGDGYSYGGGAVLFVRDMAIPFGNQKEAKMIAEELSRLWNDDMFREKDHE